MGTSSPRKPTGGNSICRLSCTTRGLNLTDRLLGRTALVSSNTSLPIGWQDPQVSPKSLGRPTGASRPLEGAPSRPSARRDPLRSCLPRHVI